MEFSAEHHPDWGSPGKSAEEALEYTRSHVRELLGDPEGTIDQRVRLAKPRNHSVKCFLDNPEDPDAFTVDVMPVLKQADGSLLIPEKLSDKWVPANPQYLIDAVARRHAEWRYFVPMIRAAKSWTREKSTGIKPLVLEVMALDHLPASDTRGEALQRYFAAAAAQISLPVVDPAGLCGELQPDLDKRAAKQHLEDAAELAARAQEARDRGDSDEAACHWNKLFGDCFPKPDGGCSEYTAAGAISSVGVASVVRPRRIKDTPQG